MRVWWDYFYLTWKRKKQKLRQGVLFFARGAVTEQRNYLYFLFMAIISHSRNSLLILPAHRGGTKCKVASNQLTQGTANKGGHAARGGALS